jgi:hypothetical protein
MVCIEVWQRTRDCNLTSGRPGGQTARQKPSSYRHRFSRCHWPEPNFTRYQHKSDTQTMYTLTRCSRHYILPCHTRPRRSRNSSGLGLTSLHRSCVTADVSSHGFCHPSHRLCLRRSRLRFSIYLQVSPYSRLASYNLHRPAVADHMQH